MPTIDEKREEKKKPSTPEKTEAQKEEEKREREKREKEQEAVRRYYWDNIVHGEGRRDRVLQMQRLADQKKFVENQSASDPDRITLGSHWINNKLEPGYYDFYYGRDPESPEADAERVTVCVSKNDEDGSFSISPGNIGLHQLKQGGLSSLFSAEDPLTQYELRRTYREIMRAYTVGLGINELTLNFPHAKDPRLIDLTKVIWMLDLAKEEGVVLNFGKNLEARLALLDPNNKKDRALRDGIYDRMQKLQKNELKPNLGMEVGRERAKAVNAFNSAGLATDTTALTKAGEALDMKEKMQALEAASNKIDTRVENIKKDIDIYKSVSGPEQYEVYREALNKTKEAVEKLTKPTMTLDSEGEKDWGKIEKDLQKLTNHIMDVIKIVDEKLKAAPDTPRPGHH